MEPVSDDEFMYVQDLAHWPTFDESAVFVEAASPIHTPIRAERTPDSA